MEDKIPNIDRNNFKVPKGYFEQLKKDILAKTNVYSQPKISKRKRWIWSVVSGIAASFLLIWTSVKLSSNESQNIEYSEMQSELMYYEETLTEYTLEELIEDDEIDFVALERVLN